MTEPIRLLSWNVWKLFGDPLAVHRVIRAAEPDLVCLQEAPAGFGSAWQLAGLARACGLHVVTGGRPAAGNAMLCSSRLQVYQAEALKFRPVNRWIQRRGAVLATVGLPGGPAIQVAGVHLSLDPVERHDHVTELVGRLAANPLPSVVAGDLNEATGGPSWQLLAAVATDPEPAATATHSARRPRKRLDAVLTGPGIETVEYGRWQPDERDALRASDHLPVLSLIRPAEPRPAEPRPAEPRPAEPCPPNSGR